MRHMKMHISPLTALFRQIRAWEKKPAPTSQRRSANICWNVLHSWGQRAHWILISNPAWKSGTFSPGLTPHISSCQVLSDLRVNVKAPARMTAEYFLASVSQRVGFESAGGMVGSGKCTVLLERAEHGNMFSFSDCATSRWEEDGSNYQRQQLREGQASAHQSALLHRHCSCCEAERVKEHPRVATSIITPRPVRNTITNTICSRVLNMNGVPFFSSKLIFTT